MIIDWGVIRRSIGGKLTATEKEALDRWLNAAARNREFYQEVCEYYQNDTPFDLPEERFLAYKMDFERRVATKLAQRRKKRIGRYMRIAAAIVLPLMVCAGVVWSVSELGWLGGEEPIRPGVIKAIVYNMDDGEHTVLTIEDSEEPARNRKEGGARGGSQADAAATQPGALHPAEADNVSRRRVVIPRGAEYPLVMQDGTTVWLNSSSELIYTVDPNARERRVYLSGEAYFDVSHDPDRPFIVVADSVEVRVYGTSFNVNTRSGRFVQTIVERGSVSVTAAGEPEKMLKPGEMGQFDRTTGKIEIHNVKVDHYLGWKSGVYIFENKPVEEILTELAMWYDVEVSYPNDAARAQRFSGSLPRNRDLSELLELMEKTTRVHFEIEGRTVVVK